MADEEITLTKAQFAEIQKAQAVLKELLTDSSTSLDLKRMMKKKHPEWNDPELEAAEKIAAAKAEVGKEATDSVAEVKKMVQDLLDERKKDKDESALNDFKSRVNKVREDYGYTEEGMNKVLEVMKERGITEPEDAAIIFEKRAPKPAPEHKPYTGRMSFVSPSSKDDPNFNKLMNDPEQFMVDEMFASLRESKQ